MLDASLEFFAHREVGGEVIELRLHQSRADHPSAVRIVRATAPWYARWGVRLNAACAASSAVPATLSASLTPSAIAQRTAGEIKDKFRRGEYGGLMTPERLTTSDRSTRRHARPATLVRPIGQPRRQRHFGTKLPKQRSLRFERDDFTSLDPRRLDEAVTQMWAEVPMHKKLDRRTDAVGRHVGYLRRRVDDPDRFWHHR